MLAFSCAGGALTTVRKISEKYCCRSPATTQQGISNTTDGRQQGRVRMRGKGVIY